MNLEQAMGFSTLLYRGVEPPPELVKSGVSLVERLFAEALERGRPFTKINTQQWQRRWMGSETFHLRRVYLNSVGMPCKPRDENHVLRQIHSGRQAEPILIDVNKRSVGTTSNGFKPKAIVLDGKHRFMAANLRGEESILAWVGEAALPFVKTLHG